MGADKGDVVYLLAGEEDYLKEEFLQELKSSIFEGGSCTRTVQGAQFDCDRFDAQENRAAEIADCARTLPFFSNARFIIVRNPQNFSTADKEIFLKLLDGPPASVRIILDTQESRLAGDFFARIQKTAQVKRFDKLKGERLKEWILKEAKMRRVRIGADGIGAIFELLGNDLRNISNALEKLSLYGAVKERGITREDVEKLCGAVSSKSGFELLDAIKRKETQSALEIVNGLMAQGKPATEVLGILIWHFARLGEARALLRKGATNQAIAAKTRVPSYFLDKFLQEARAFEGDKFTKCVDELLEAESAIKSGRTPPKIALELCLSSLCGLYSRPFDFAQGR